MTSAKRGSVQGLGRFEDTRLPEHKNDTVYFTTDSSVNFKGFRATWKQID